MFFQDYKSFQTKFYEIQNLQRKRENFIGEKNELRQIKNKINFGVKKLKEYKENMENIRKMIKYKNKRIKKKEDQENEQTLLDETLNKTKELIRIIDKQELIYKNKSKKKNKDTNPRIAMGEEFIDEENEEELNEHEFQFLKEWDDQMKDIDSKMEDLYSRLVVIDERIDEQGLALEENRQMINQIHTNTANLNEKLSKVNSDLKKSLTKLRAPNKLCIDLILFGTLAIMIAILIWCIRFFWSLN